MGVNAFDVQNLNNAISGVGQGFEQRHKDAIEQSIRQRMLDVEMRRMTAEEGRQATAAGGQVKQWLQSDGSVDPDSGEGIAQSGPPSTMYYEGPPSGLQDLMDKKQAAGTPMKPIPPPQTKPPLAFTITHPNGMHISTAVNSLEDIDKLKKELEAKGFNAIKPTTGKTTTVQENEAADKEDELQAKLQAHLAEVMDTPTGATSGPPFGTGMTGEDKDATIKGINAAIEQSKARKSHVLHNDVPMEVGSEPAPLGADARPGSKAGTRKVFAPRGQVLNPPAAAAATVQPAPSDPKQRKAGVTYSTPKGELKWTGTGWVNP